MTAYAWSDRHIPYPVVSEYPEWVSAIIGGKERSLPKDRIRGRCQTGDRVSILLGGGYWVNCTLQDGYPLTAIADDGETIPIWTTSTMRQLICRNLMQA